MFPTKLNVDGNTFTDPTDIANEFNRYFTNVGPNLASSLPEINDDPTKYISNTPASSFYLAQVSEDEIASRLRSLNIRKSSVDIPYYFLKIASAELAKPITCIINQSIETGIVPDLFKISCITPIFKGGDFNDSENYRPIAILPSLNKILERVVYDQLLKFLDKHNTIYNYQFGFRKKHSTEQAILELTDTIKNSIDNRQLTCGIFLDFKKAFDTTESYYLNYKNMGYEAVL